MTQKPSDVFHHNMSVKDAIKIARDYGFSIEPKDRHGELTFTHPKIDKPYTISINKSEIGRGFLSWAKPAFEDSSNKEENKMTQSFQHTVAKVIAERSKKGKPTTADHVLIELEYKIPRKKVSDTLVHIYKKGLAHREDIGVYSATELLLNLMTEKLEPIETPAEEPVEEPTEEAVEEAIEIPTEEPDENKQTYFPDEYEEDEDEDKDLYIKSDNIVSRFEEKLNQLEVLCDQLEGIYNRLKNVLSRFEETEEMKEIVEMFNEILEKRKKK
jgi:hypothetical protein